MAPRTRGQPRRQDRGGNAWGELEGSRFKFQACPRRRQRGISRRGAEAQGLLGWEGMRDRARQRCGRGVLVLVLVLVLEPMGARRRVLWDRVRVPPFGLSTSTSTGGRGAEGQRGKGILPQRRGGGRSGSESLSGSNPIGPRFRFRYRPRHQWDGGIWSRAMGGTGARRGNLRTLFRVRDSIGMWTPGRPRSSADPGLPAATPPALVQGLVT